MTRFLVLSLLVVSASAFGEPEKKGAKPPAAAGKAETEKAPEPKPEEKPVEKPPAPAPEAAVAPSLAAPIEREQLKREVLDEVQKALTKNKEEVRDEIRAQITTQAANRSFEEEFQEEKKKLELLELDGYFRIRPDLLYNFDLRRGADPDGFHLFPPPLIEGANRKTLAGANMRLRVEPTLNVSEDVRIKAQMDVFDNLVLGSTPEGGFGLSDRTPLVVFSQSQVPPESQRNSYVDSLRVKRLFGEVMTPVGLLRFGRMGSLWGLGILAHDGNCPDCDFGDSADRVMFVTKVANHYVVPIIDFVAEGPTSAKGNEAFGQPFDRDQLDDATNYILAVARRDTDVEIQRKLTAGQNILNYGLYFVYRRQVWDAASFYKQRDPNGGDVNDVEGFAPRDAAAYVPDLWFKLQTKKLRIEAELVAVFGRIGNRAAVGEFSNKAEENQAVTIQQFGGALVSDYKVLDNIGLSGEVGFASGDVAPGMGNKPGRLGPTKPGSIDGYQFCFKDCVGGIDNRLTNFRFNRDYRVDMILWRELIGGVTDAVYIKPGMKYEVTDGLHLTLHGIYSRAVFGESTPSSVIDKNGKFVGDPNLGVELNAGVSYTTDDGFSALLRYGILFPLGGLANNATQKEGETAQAVRALFAIRY